MNLFVESPLGIGKEMKWGGDLWLLVLASHLSFDVRTLDVRSTLLNLFVAW
jgi:hypothetical protein